MPGVDADEPAFGIHQRAAGIALVDRRIGLDEIFIAVERRSRRTDGPVR